MMALIDQALKQVMRVNREHMGTITKLENSLMVISGELETARSAQHANRLVSVIVMQCENLIMPISA